jgi:hypothetical protein
MHPPYRYAQRWQSDSDILTLSDATDSKAIQDQRDAEKRPLEALQAQRRKAMEKLRVALQREVMLQKLRAKLGGDVHHF